MKKIPAILVTGGSGIIGSLLIEKLLSDHKVIAIGKNLEKFPVFIRQHKNFKFYTYDLTTSLRIEISDRLDAIVHLAAIVSGLNRSSQEYLDVNLRSTEELLHFATKCRIKKFIFASSVSVYGEGPGLKTENDPLLGKTNYAFSKISAEKKVQQSKLNFIIFRLASVYGKNTKGYINKLAGFLKKGFIPSPENERSQKSFIYIEDAVEFFIRAIDSKKKIRGIYNIAYPDPVLYEALAGLLRSKLNRKFALKIRLSKTVKFLIGALNKIVFYLKIAKTDRLFDSTSFSEPISVSSEKAIREFGYAPKIGINEGIEKTFMDL